MATFIKPRYQKKDYWVDPKTGYHFTGGGILFFDDVGIWTVGEMQGGTIEYTDPGGRYNYNDCNIWGTIRRELWEETYGMCDLTTSQIESFTSGTDQPIVYVNGHTDQPVYLCIVARLPKNMVLREDEFIRRRDITVGQNPDTPPKNYKTLCIKRIRYTEISNGTVNLSRRLRLILKNTTFGA
jgi:hypothetical protein